MKFSEIEYKRPDIEKITTEFDKLLNNFQTAESAQAQNIIIKDINKLRIEFHTMATVASIKYSIDTLSEFNREEQDFFDENFPIYEGLINKYYSAILNSNFRKELEETWGKQLFSCAELTLKTYRPEIVEDLQTENHLKTQYSKLIASAKIMFDGKERSLSELGPYLQSTDRNIRKEANIAKWNYFSENSQKLDSIYDDLVKVRHRMALKLGFKNFIDMGYARMERTDYDAGMVSDFRKQVEKYIVPITLKLKEKQRERLGLPDLKYYDQLLDFKDGNAKPKGNPEWIEGCAKNMYEELSPETGEFFNFMLENELMDLVAKIGKDTGGFCTFIEKYKAPFIFSNFNGTAGDVEVLTHEAGHAFQTYSSRNFDIPEYHFPTAEACEIHSMSMEFLTWPWMECFFKEQTEKFKYSHLQGSLFFIPYGVAVDEFQHYVYENPDATPEMRKQKWLEVEKKYLPYLDYDNNEFLKQGGRWQWQRHIYSMPFYYIDYCLAQICAYQFWKKSRENRDKAIKDYLRLCEAGGSASFLDLVKIADLISPFKDGCIESFVGSVEEWLDKVDDKKL